MAKADLAGLYRQSHQIRNLRRKVWKLSWKEQEEYSSWFTLYSAESDMIYYFKETRSDSTAAIKSN